MERNAQIDIQAQVKGILPAVIDVITGPVEFFRHLPKTGGFLQPFIFMVVLGAASGLITIVLSLIGLAPTTAILSGAAIILMPIMIAIFGFIGAAVLFVIWKIMGSQESFETAYRGGAYTAAIMPGTAILNLIPYLGSLIGLVWMTFLLVVISMEMHGIKQKTAWTGFGVICAIFAMMSLSAEVAGRKMEKNMQAWQQENVLDLEQLQDATPEEVGKVLGQFLKGIQEAAEQSK
jgi:hypothetical protein